MTINKKFDRQRTLRRYFLIGLLISTGVAGALLVIRIHFSFGQLPRDSYSYMEYADTAFLNGFATAERQFPQMATYPPLLCLLMVALMHCGLTALAAGMLLNISGVLLAVAGVYCCQWYLWKHKIYALPATLLVLSLPQIYDNGYGILRDSLFWALCCWTGVVLIRLSGKSDSLRSVFRIGSLLGILCGIMILCRKEGFWLLMAVAVAWAGYLSAYCSRWRNKFFRMFAGETILFIGTGLVLLSVRLFGVSYDPISLMAHWMERI